MTYPSEQWMMHRAAGGLGLRDTYRPCRSNDRVGCGAHAVRRWLWATRRGRKTWWLWDPQVA